TPVRYERLTTTGRYVEVHFRPLDDGTILFVHRDITELKQRAEALAAAKEAAEAARDDVERTRRDMQVVLDHMTDGVMLLGEDRKIRFSNQRFHDHHRFPHDVAFPGANAKDVLRFQTRRGDFGPDDDVEKMV